MRFSVIICTYRRPDDLERLLGCLASQAFRAFELIVVDGSGADSAVRESITRFMAAHPALDVRLLSTSPGLTRQRNAGLSGAQGDIVCFLDDDVSFDADFLERAAGIFAEPGMAAVGGITGFDSSSYAQPVGWHWRLSRWLGVIPSLEPGAIDRVGRRAPIEIAAPTPTRQRVGWLPGFCMLFRRTAIGDLSFDEMLPTYAGEDKEFSASVGAAHGLMLCTDLRLVHHRSPASRNSEAGRVYQIGFGMGRGFARRRLPARHILSGTRYALGAISLYLLRFLHRPSRDRLASIGALPLGVLAGLRSVERPE